MNYESNRYSPAPTTGEAIQKIESFRATPESISNQDVFGFIADFARLFANNQLSKSFTADTRLPDGRMLFTGYSPEDQISILHVYRLEEGSLLQEYEYTFVANDADHSYWVHAKTEATLPHQATQKDREQVRSLLFSAYMQHFEERD